MADEWKARFDRSVEVPLLHLSFRGGAKIGDHVSWNSEAGRVSGLIRRKVSAPVEFKGYTVRASREEPQYLIESDKTGHLAMHKGSALRKLPGRAGARTKTRSRGRRRGKGS
jgi:hypothetical protein